MQLSHTPAAASAVFDDPNLIGSAGLIPVLRLAETAGLGGLADARLSVPTDKGANAGAKVTALVAGMVAGADSIEDMALLRHGGMRRLFGRCYAPSTLGSFLRTFTFGHVRQLDAVAGSVVALRDNPMLTVDPVECLARNLDDPRDRRIRGGRQHGDECCAGVDRQLRFERAAVGDLQISHHWQSGRFSQLGNHPDAVALDERGTRFDQIDDPAQGRCQGDRKRHGIRRSAQKAKRRDRAFVYQFRRVLRDRRQEVRKGGSRCKVFRQLSSDSGQTAA